MYLLLNDERKSTKYLFCDTAIQTSSCSSNFIFALCFTSSGAVNELVMRYLQLQDMSPLVKNIFRRLKSAECKASKFCKTCNNLIGRAFIGFHFRVFGADFRI